MSQSPEVGSARNSGSSLPSGLSALALGRFGLRPGALTSTSLTIETPVAGFAEWQIKPAVAAGLEQLGWRGDESAVRDVVPVVARGGNLVAVLPPAPAWADPIMAALLGAQSAVAGQVLVLAAPAAVSEWAVAVGAVTESDPIRIDVAREVRGAAGRPPARDRSTC